MNINRVFRKLFSANLWAQMAFYCAIVGLLFYPYFYHISTECLYMVGENIFLMRLPAAWFLSSIFVVLLSIIAYFRIKLSQVANESRKAKAAVFLGGFLFIMTSLLAFIDTTTCAQIHSMKFTARDTVKDFQKYTDSGGVILFKHCDGPGCCAELENAQPDFTCNKILPGVSASRKYSTFGEAASLYAEHANYELEYTSPYDGTSLFTNTPAPGHISFEQSDGRDYFVIALHDDGQVICRLPLPVIIPE